MFNLPGVPLVLGAMGLVALVSLVFYGARSPIFWIDLITTSRRLRYFGVRMLYASGLLVILYLAYENTVGRQYWYGTGMGATIQQTAAFAEAFYHQFAFLQLLAVTLLTPAMIAGVIATEREGKTIEYLFASDLSDQEIVLGKLATRIAQLLSYMLVALPILALASLFGGIGGERLLQAFAVSASMLCSTAGLSLAMSVRSLRARDAVIGTYLILLAVLIAPVLLAELTFALARGVGGSSVILDALYDLMRLSLTAHPYVVLGKDLQMATAGGAIDWTPILVLVSWHAIFTAITVAMAVWGVRRLHLRSVSAGVRKPLSMRLNLPVFRPAMGDYPMLWKELFAEHWRLGFFAYLALGILVTVVVLPIGYAFFETLGRGGGSEYSGISSGFSAAIVCGTLLILAARASMSITSERERDTWLSLTSTTLTATEVVVAKVLGSLYSVRYMALLLAAIWAVSFLRHPPVFSSLVFHFGTVVILGLFTSNLGVMFSLCSSTSLRAMAGTLATMVFLGGAYFCCCTPIFFMGRGGSDWEITFAPCLVFLIATSGYIHEMQGRYDQEMVAIYAVGMFLYVLATFALFVANVSAFDRLAGRTLPRTYVRLAPVTPVVGPRPEEPKSPFEPGR